MSESILNNKRILAVDDEPDVLETLEELLDGFDGLIFDSATDYETGYQLIRSWTYDAVILDIMGVRGFDLLNASVHLGFPTVMLTAHALTPEALKKSIKLGAVTFLPKDKMSDLRSFLEDVVLGEGKPVWQKFFEKLGAYFNKHFGPDWVERDQFLKEFKEELMGQAK